MASSVSRSYDDDLRVATETAGGGPGVSYGYDPDSLLDLVTPAGGTPLDLLRDPAQGFGAGLLTGTTQGVVTTSELPSAFGEPASLTATANGNPLYHLDVSDRDALGRIETRVETVQGTTTTTVYGYDPAGRLAASTRSP